MIKAVIALLTLFASLPCLALQVEFSGRLMLEENQHVLHYSQNGKAMKIETNIDRQFLGQEIWASGEIKGQTLYALNVVTAKNSLIGGQVGQAVALVGSLEPNGFKGLDFYPENEEAIKYLGRSGLRIIFPEGHYMAGSTDYVHRAQIWGFVTEGKLIVSKDPYTSFNVLTEKSEIGRGDTIVVSGYIDENDEYVGGGRRSKEENSRDHIQRLYERDQSGLTYGSGGSNPYNWNSAVKKGQYIILGSSDLLVKSLKSGQLVPATTDSNIYATAANDRAQKIISKALPTDFDSSNGKHMSFIGQIGPDGVFYISDVSPYLGTGVVPTLTSTPPTEDKSISPTRANSSAKPSKPTRLKLVSSKDKIACAKLLEGVPVPHIYLVKQKPD